MYLQGRYQQKSEPAGLQILGQTEPPESGLVGETRLDRKAGRLRSNRECLSYSLEGRHIQARAEYDLQKAIYQPDEYVSPIVSTGVNSGAGSQGEVNPLLLLTL